MLKSTKKGKAAGWDGINSTLLHWLLDSKLFIFFLYNLFNACMNYSFWQSSWNHLIIAPVLKPGRDPLVAASYRPIHLISVNGKLLAQITEKRLRVYVPRSPEQMGFNPGHGTRDNVFVLSSIFDSYKHRGLYCAFVDFKGAVDSVDRSLLLTNEASQ